MEQPGKVANSDCGQLNRENEYWTCMMNLHVLIFIRSQCRAINMCPYNKTIFSLSVVENE